MQKLLRILLIGLIVSVSLVWPVFADPVWDDEPDVYDPIIFELC